MINVYSISEIIEASDKILRSPIKDKDNFLTPLYSKLPVIIVKDWSQINKNYLKKQLKIIKSKKYDFSILFMRYWINKIYQKKNTSEKIKYNLFLSRFFKNNIKCF